MAEYEDLENTDYDPNPVYLEDTPTNADDGPVIDLEDGRIRPQGEREAVVRRFTAIPVTRTKSVTPLSSASKRWGCATKSLT